MSDAQQQGGHRGSSSQPGAASAWSSSSGPSAPRGIGEDEFALFIEQCKRSGLDPLLKEAFCVARRAERGQPGAAQLGDEATSSSPRRRGCWRAPSASRTSRASRRARCTPRTRSSWTRARARWCTASTRPSARAAWWAPGRGWCATGKLPGGGVAGLRGLRPADAAVGEDPHDDDREVRPRGGAAQGVPGGLRRPVRARGDAGGGVRGRAARAAGGRRRPAPRPAARPTTRTARRPTRCWAARQRRRARRRSPRPPWPRQRRAAAGGAPSAPAKAEKASAAQLVIDVQAGDRPAPAAERQQRRPAVTVVAFGPHKGRRPASSPTRS